VQNRYSIVQMAFLLWIVYLALTANLESVNLIFGILISLGISFLIQPQRLSIAWERTPLAIVSGFRYLGVLIMDMIKSGIQVGKIILTPGLPINPGIIEINAGCQSELNTALTAHNLTLTPGEIVLEMDDQGILFVHCLDTRQSEQYITEIKKLRKELLSNIFE